jgi:hypothetical protein
MRARVRFTVIAAALVGAAALASTAAAGQPVKTSFSNVPFSSTMSGVCSFDVNVDSVVSGFEIDYFDAAGNITKADIHETEQDTFTANGKTLTGLPYTFNLRVAFDSSGNPTSIVATGVVATVPLPDGSVFHSAGQVDFLDHPGATFLLSPDKGNPGNVAGFCAALSP